MKSDQKIEALELKLAAHRILLSSLLVKVFISKEDMETMEATILNKKLGAWVRTKYPETGDAFFEEIQHIILMSSLASNA